MKLFGSTIALTALISTTLFIASPSSADNVTFPDLVFARPHRDLGSGVPGDREDKASRGESCGIPMNAQLLALIPEEKVADREVAPGVPISQSSNVWGRTVSDTPALWLSLNQPVNDAILKLEMATVDNDVIVAIEQPISVEAGVFSVVFPQGSLTDVNTLYQWRATIEADCVTDGSLRRAMVKGWIERVDVPDGVALAQTPEAEATAYAAAGIWFDALEIVAELNQSNPHHTWAVSAWNALMAAGDLEVPVSRLTTSSAVTTQ